MPMQSPIQTGGKNELITTWKSDHIWLKIARI